MKCKYLYDTIEFLELDDCEQQKECRRRTTVVVIFVSLLTKVIIALCGYFLASNHGSALLWSILIVAGLASEAVWSRFFQMELFASYDIVKETKVSLTAAEGRIRDLEWKNRME